ncbi:hypothetical protein ACFQ0T_03330 [Kitasatospora gansuensis]
MRPRSLLAAATVATVLAAAGCSGTAKQADGTGAAYRLTDTTPAARRS